MRRALDASPRRGLAALQSLGGALLLATLVLLFWKLRILSSGAKAHHLVGTSDLYVLHHPMASYGFAALREGRIPLWDPYQLAGQPFLAVPVIGLFYPPNLIYLLLDTAVATELSMLAHLLLAGGSMWLLLRHVGTHPLAGLTGGLTYMWSGFMMKNLYQPPILDALAWLPVFVLLVDRVLDGRRWAALGLAGTSAAILLTGSGEVFLHAAYVGGLFALCRLAPRVARGQWRDGATAGLLIAAALLVGVLLALPQILPTLELVSQSMRSSVSLAESAEGSVPPLVLVWRILGSTHYVAGGALPVFALLLSSGSRLHRSVWAFATLAVVGSGLLIVGGEAFRLHHALPWGDLFRSPAKFHSIYCFAQAVLVGLAVDQLSRWRREPRSRLWSRPAWLGALLAGSLGAVFLLQRGAADPYLATASALLVLFGVVSRPQARSAVLVVLCAVQGMSLFVGLRDPMPRPFARPKMFTQHELFGRLPSREGDLERLYLSLVFNQLPTTMPKQGILGKIPVANDYGPLFTERVSRYFATMGGSQPDLLFSGGYFLQEDTRLPMLDLAGVRYLALIPRKGTDAWIKRASSDPLGKRFRELFRAAPIVVFENERALPRAWLVPRARVLGGPDEVLQALGEADFDPRSEVLLETPADDAPSPRASDAVGNGAEGAVEILSHEAERVVIGVKNEAPAYLVLADAYYPGWEAREGGRALPILRANYLFRAVRLAPGLHEVVFEFRPASFRIGAAVSLATAGSLVVGVAAAVWRRRNAQGHAT